VVDHELHCHGAGDAVEVEDVRTGEVVPGAIDGGIDDGRPHLVPVGSPRHRLSDAVAGRPIGEGPRQLGSSGRGIGRIDGPNGVGRPDGAVEEGDGQGRHQAGHPRRDDSGPPLVVDRPLEVPDPLWELPVVTERFSPFEVDRCRRVDRRPAGAGDAPSPPVDDVVTAQRGQRLTGHGSVVDEAVRKLEAR
jgi:hypothetical protein